MHYKIIKIKLLRISSNCGKNDVQIQPATITVNRIIIVWAEMDHVSELKIVICWRLQINYES